MLVLAPPRPLLMPPSFAHAHVTFAECQAVLLGSAHLLFAVYLVFTGKVSFSPLLLGQSGFLGQPKVTPAQLSMNERKKEIDTEF